MRVRSRTNSNKKTIPFIRKIPVLVWFDFKCAECGKDKDLTVDHLVQRKNGGSHNYGNLVLLCSSCHQIKNGVKPGSMPLPTISEENIKRARAVLKLILLGFFTNVEQAYRTLYPNNAVWLLDPLRKVSRHEKLSTSGGLQSF